MYRVLGMDAAAARRGRVFLPPILVRLARLAAGWRERARTRRALWTLGDRMLRDVGLDRVEAGREALKPFWKD